MLGDPTRPSDFAPEEKSAFITRGEKNCTHHPLIRGGFTAIEKIIGVVALLVYQSALRVEVDVNRVAEGVR